MAVTTPSPIRKKRKKREDLAIGKKMSDTLKKWLELEKNTTSHGTEVATKPRNDPST